MTAQPAQGCEANWRRLSRITPLSNQPTSDTMRTTLDVHLRGHREALMFDYLQPLGPRSTSAAGTTPSGG